MKLYTKTGSESQITKEERTLIMGGYSKADRALEKDLQPFEDITAKVGESLSGSEHKISWLE